MTTSTRPEPGTAVQLSPVARALTVGREDIEQLLPEGMTFNRVVSIVRLEAMKNPALQNCTELSLIQSTVRILRWGLEIGDNAYLIPYKNKKSGLFEATAVADYKGLSALMVASRAVRAVQAKAVFEGDEFEYELGLRESLRHWPQSDPAKRGAIKGAYAILRLPFGGDVFDYMSIEDIEAIRKTSQQWGPDKHPVCPPWYARKCVIRQTSKLMPKSPRLTQYWRVVAEDTELESGEPVTGAPIRATARIVDDDRPSAAAAPANPEGPATEEQINHLLEIIEHPAIAQQMRDQITEALRKRLKASRIAVIIAGVEKLIAEAPKPDPVPAPADDDGLPF